MSDSRPATNHPLMAGCLVLFVIGCAGAVIGDLVNGPAPVPSTATEPVATRMNRWSAINVSMAEASIGKLLKDPDSAKFQDVAAILPAPADINRPGVVCGFVNSRNSFGAYTGAKAFIWLGGIPVSEEGTKSKTFQHLWNRNCANKKTLG